MSQKRTLCHKIQFCYINTKLNSVSQNSILSHKIQFCFTKFNSVNTKCDSLSKKNSNSVSQHKILFHTSRFCATKFNYFTQTSILEYTIKLCLTKVNSVAQKSIPFNKIKCWINLSIENLHTELKVLNFTFFKSDLSIDMNFVTQNWNLSWTKILFLTEMTWQ